MAFKMDRRGCLNKHQPPYTGQLLALCIFGWIVECIGPQLDVTLILLHARRSFFVDDAESA